MSTALNITAVVLYKILHPDNWYEAIVAVDSPDDSKYPIILAKYLHVSDAEDAAKRWAKRLGCELVTNTVTHELTRTR